ncbi:MAG: hypothetical protein Q9M27_00500 [Mariprofundaceae bacterium]|nr:hypothetical protein [Mariprofundaceae bacterium]
MLQDEMDRFVRTRMLKNPEQGKLAEECMESLADYLLNYSDLFQDDLAETDESPLADWERALETHMRELMDDDMEFGIELYGLKLEQLEPEHMRDFFGWHLLREMSGDAAGIEEYVRITRQWLAFLAEKGKIIHSKYLEFEAVLNELAPECERTAKAARLLFHFVRLGSGMSPRLRGQRFSRFVEGHARIAALETHQIFLSFDNQEDRIGPVPLAREITGLLKPGDVLDVELGLRSGVWMMVDIGPVYPASVYVDAEAFEPLSKIS